MSRVYLTSPWLPFDWVYAHELEPVGAWLRAEAGQGIPAPAAGECAFACEMLHHAIRQKDAAFIFSSHCDQLRRTVDAIPPEDAPRIFLFNLPACSESPAAARMYASEMERLGRFLVRIGGQAPTVGVLRVAIEKWNRQRDDLRRMAAQTPARLFLEKVACHFGADGPVTAAAALAGGPPNVNRVPLAIVGGPFSRVQWPVLDIVERLGGRIVLVATEPGERHLWSIAPESISSACSLGEMVRGFAEACARGMVDMYQRPNTRFYSWLGEKLRERGAKGILLWHYTWCDLWRAEAQSMREAFGLPVLPLDADGPEGELPRKENRIEAFVEALR